MEDDNSGLEGLEDTTAQEKKAAAALSNHYQALHDLQRKILIGKDILKSIEQLHYIIKDNTLKQEETQVLLDYRDSLVRMLKVE